MAKTVWRDCLPSKLTRKVCWSTAIASAMLASTSWKTGCPLSLKMPKLKAASSAVSGVPSCHRASGRIWKVKLFQSSAISTLSASSP